MRLFNDSIDIETYYDVYNNNVVDIKNNSYVLINLNDAKIPFKNNTLTYLGYDVRINYIRNKEIWVAIGETNDGEHIEAEGLTYSEAIKNIKDKIDIMYTINYHI